MLASGISHFVHFIRQNKHFFIQLLKAHYQSVHSRTQLSVYSIDLRGQFLVVLLMSKEQQFELPVRIVIHYSEGLRAS